MFSRFEILEIIIADNNPCDSLEFKNNCLKQGFHIINLSSNYHKRNGLDKKALCIA